MTKDQLDVCLTRTQAMGLALLIESMDRNSVPPDLMATLRDALHLMYAEDHTLQWDQFNAWKALGEPKFNCQLEAA